MTQKRESTGEGPKSLSLGNIYTTHEASKLLCLAPKTLANLRCKGGGPKHLKVAGRIVYTEVHLEEFLRACVRGSTSE